MSDSDGGSTGSGSSVICDAVVMVSITGVLLAPTLECSGHWVIVVADVDYQHISTIPHKLEEGQGNLRPSLDGSIFLCPQRRRAPKTGFARISKTP